LIFVGAMRVVFSAAAVAFGDVGRNMFDATAIYAPANTAGAVSAMPYSAGYGQPVPYMQPVEYVQPMDVQPEAAGWGVSDVAMLCVAGAAVGAVVGQRVKSRAAGAAAAEADVELAMDGPLLAAPEITARAGPVRRAGPVSMMAKSRALPWQECPEHLEGMIGNAGFDPLGLSTPQNISWMREAELQHGRLCMLAWTGYIAVDLGIKFPGEKYAALTSFTAHDATARLELFYVLLLTGTCETIKFSPIYAMMEGSLDRKAGDFGFDPLKLLTPENEVKYKTAELTHGRAAMLAFSGVVTQCALGHTTFPYVN